MQSLQKSIKFGNLPSDVLEMEFNAIKSDRHIKFFYSPYHPAVCDFQYLPVTNNSTLGSLEPLIDLLVPRQVINAPHFLTRHNYMFCVPQLFARSDTVPNNIFRNISIEDGQNEILGAMHKSSYNNRDVVIFNMIDSIPSRPDLQIIKIMKVKYVSDEQLEKVKKLFDDCPIWTRIALLYESGISNDKLKCIIPSLAYYFSNGPWRTLYVRFGYDPRKDFHSRYYQTFDFRLRFRSGVAVLVEKRKVSKIRQQEIPLDANAIIQGVDYPYFEETKFPRSRQCILRYCDIRMSKIQAMLSKIPTPLAGTTCNERSGWLPAGFDGQVRQILSNVIKDLIRKYCRKDNIISDLMYFNYSVSNAKK